MPPIRRSGIKTPINEVLIESTVNPISRAPRNAACTGRKPCLHIARDVLQDHDRIVHHESGRNRQRHERQVVEAVLQEIHGPKRPDQ